MMNLFRSFLAGSLSMISVQALAAPDYMCEKVVNNFKVRYEITERSGIYVHGNEINAQVVVTKEDFNGNIKGRQVFPAVLDKSKLNPFRIRVSDRYQGRVNMDIYIDLDNSPLASISQSNFDPKQVDLPKLVQFIFKCVEK